jgi:hypothetical protein
MNTKEEAESNGIIAFPQKRNAIPSLPEHHKLLLSSPKITYPKS